MSIFNTQSAEREYRWVWSVVAMCVVLGIMFSMAWVREDNRRSRLAMLAPTQSSRINEATVDLEAFQDLKQEVKKLLDEKTKLENALAGTNSQTKALNESLQDTKIFAGLTDLEGPGVLVTLKDSASAGTGLPGDKGVSQDIVIHDTDVLRVVNELFSSGADSVSVNENRITGRSSLRCVGPTILVNDLKIASPIEIRALGDPKTLLGAMNLPGGILSEIRMSDPGMVQIEKVDRMTIRAYTGSTDTRFSKVPSVKK